MLTLTPYLAQLRNPALAPPPPPVAETFMRRLRLAQGLFLGVVIGHEPDDVAHRLDVISETRQQAAWQVAKGSHATLAARFDPPTIAELLTDVELGPWERPLLIVQSEAGPSVQVFTTSIDGVTAYRTGEGLVPSLEGWREHALFGLLVLRESVLVWTRERGESVVRGEDAQGVLDSILPNLETQLEIIHAARLEAAHG